MPLKDNNPYKGNMASVKIDTTWLQYIPDKEHAIQMLLSCSGLRDTLLKVLTKALESELRQPREDYTNPNWALLQADKNGSVRTIERFINLLTIKD